MMNRRTKSKSLSNKSSEKQDEKNSLKKTQDLLGVGLSGTLATGRDVRGPGFHPQPEKKKKASKLKSPPFNLQRWEKIFQIDKEKVFLKI
jgi:hypothetical protein